MQTSPLDSLFDRAVRPVARSTPACSVYSASGKYRSAHMLSLRRTILRILQKPNLRQRREVASLEFTLKCGQVFCDVCSEFADVGNMVVCSGCRAVVHRGCYGGILVTKGAWGEWLCDLCFVCGLHEVPSAAVTCALCETRYGAMKRVQRLGWVHPGCVVYSDALDFADDAHDAVTHIPKPQSALCKYCLRQSPWTAKCAQADCGVTFHYRCAQSAGLRPHWKGAELYLFCKPHRIANLGLDPDSKAVRKQFRYYRTLQPNLTVPAVESSDRQVMHLRSAKPLPAIEAQKPVERPAVVRKPKKRPPARSKAPVKRFKSMADIRLPRPLKPKEEQRLLTNELSELTGIHKPGTCKELENRLKEFLRQNKKRDDYNFYDVSHMPELVRVLGYGGKVEHRLLPTVVLQHSFVVTV